MLLTFVLKEGLVGAHHFGVLVQALPHASTQADEAFYAIRGQERVAEDLLRLLANAVDASGALDQANDGPGKIEVHDDAAVLEVLALAQDIRRKQHTQFVLGCDLVPLLVALGAEAPGVARRVFRVAGHSRAALQAARPQLLIEVAHGIGELREDDDLVLGVLRGQELVQGGELVIPLRVPVAALRQDLHEPGGVVTQIRGQRRDEEVRAQPSKAALELCRVQRIHGRRPLPEVVFCTQARSLASRARRVVLILEQFGAGVGIIHVCIVVAGVQQPGVLCAYGQRQALVDGVEEDVVAQGVARDGLLKHLATAFEALEEVGAAEAHQAFTGPRQVLNDLVFGLGARALWRRGDVVAQTVARQIQGVDGRDDVGGVEAAVLIVGVVLVRRERHGSGDAVGEVRPAAVRERQELPPGGRIERGVVVLDKGARAPHHVEAHQLAPIVRVVALLERGERAHRALVAADELGLAEITQQPLRAHAQILVLGHEEAQLAGEVDVGLVVRCRREQDALAVVFLDVLLDGAIALPRPVAQVVALVNQDDAVAPQGRQLTRRPGDREHLRQQPVLGDVVLPHRDEVLRADDQRFSEVIVLEDLGDRARHERLA